MSGRWIGAKRVAREIERNPVTKVAVGLGGLVLAAAGVLLAIRAPGEPTADSSDLVVKALPPSPITSFVIPSNIDFTTAFEGHSAGRQCSPTELEKLRAMGHESNDHILFTIRNSANSGGQLSLTNVRATGTRTSPLGPIFVVECPSPGEGNGEGDFVPVTLNLDNEEEGTTTEDRPFIFNLAPGEVGSFGIYLHGTQEFSGILMATVTAGNDVKAIDLPFNANSPSPKFVRAGVGDNPALIVSPRYVANLDSFVDPLERDPRLLFYCKEAGTAEPCSLLGVQVRLKRWKQDLNGAGMLVRDVVSALDCSDRENATSTLYQSWHGWYLSGYADADPIAFDHLLVDPFRAMAEKCGLSFADDVAKAVVGSGPTFMQLHGISPQEATSTAPPGATCTEPALREAAMENGDKPLGDSVAMDGKETYLYDSFEVIACTSTLAIVEASHSSGSAELFWALRSVESKWKIGSSTAVRFDADEGQALWSCDDLRGSGFDPTEVRAAIESNHQTFDRDVCR